jgi:hypothetical protein
MKTKLVIMAALVAAYVIPDQAFAQAKAGAKKPNILVIWG